MTRVAAITAAMNTTKKPIMSPYSGGNWVQLRPRKPPSGSFRLAARKNEKTIDSDARSGGGSCPA